MYPYNTWGMQRIYSVVTGQLNRFTCLFYWSLWTILDLLGSYIGGLAFLHLESVNVIDGNSFAKP